jgi:hypothetical protein
MDEEEVEEVMMEEEEDLGVRHGAMDSCLLQACRSLIV